MTRPRQPRLTPRPADRPGRGEAVPSTHKPEMAVARRDVAVVLSALAISVRDPQQPGSPSAGSPRRPYPSSTSSSQQHELALDRPLLDSRDPTPAGPGRNEHRCATGDARSRRTTGHVPLPRMTWRIDAQEVNCDSLTIRASGIRISRSMLNGRISLDTDRQGAADWSFELTDSEVSAGQVQLPAVASETMWSNVPTSTEVKRRCNVKPVVRRAERDLSSSCLVYDSYLHGQQMPPDSDWHLGGFLTEGGDNTIVLDHNYVVCDAPTRQPSRRSAPVTSICWETSGTSATSRSPGTCLEPATTWRTARSQAPRPRRIRTHRA